jgi:hypothetical protein
MFGHPIPLDPGVGQVRLGILKKKKKKKLDCFASLPPVKSTSLQVGT